MNHLNSPNLTRCNPQWTTANSFWIHFTLFPAFSPMIPTSSVSHIYQICFCLKNMMLAVTLQECSSWPLAPFHRFQLRGPLFWNVFPEVTMRCPNISPTCTLFPPNSHISGDSLDLLWAFHLSSVWPEHLPTLLCNCLLISHPSPTLGHTADEGVTESARNLFSHPCVMHSALRMFRLSLSLFLTNKQTNKKHSASFWFPSGIQQMLSTCCLPLRSQGQRQILRGSERGWVDRYGVGEVKEERRGQ